MTSGETSAHVSDELPRLLSGEATREEVLAAAPHLRGCVDCQQELVSAVVAHAALASARRFAPEVLARRADEGPDAGERGAHGSDEPLPDLSAVFAKVRREADAPRSPGAARPGRARLVAAAAAAGVLIGGGGVALGTQLAGSSESGRSIALAAYDKGTNSASARLSDTTLSVNASSLPRLDTGHRYEVWLTDPARTRMQPVGWIGADGKATLTVPHELADSFHAIEVSVQNLSAPSYDYSGTSVLRGSYR